MYLVKYSRGSGVSYIEYDLFITENPIKVDEYITRFNKVITDYKEHCKWLKETIGVDLYWDKYTLLSINKAWFEKIHVK